MKKRSYSVGGLIAFEFKKLAASRKNWAVIAILCVTVFLFVAYNMQQEEQERREVSAECDFLVTWYGYKAGTYADFYDFFENPALQKYAEVSEKRSAYFEALAGAYRADDAEAIVAARRVYYDFQIEFIDWMADYAATDEYNFFIKSLPTELGDSFRSALAVNREESYYFAAQKAYYEELEASGAQPIISLHDMSAFHFLYRFLTTLFPTVVLIAAFLLLSDTMSAEKDAGSYKFLLLQPVSRGKVLLIKILAGMLYAAAVTLVLLLAAFLLTGLMNGFGTPDYPVLADADGLFSFEASRSNYYAEIDRMQYNGIYHSLNMRVDRAYPTFETLGDGLHLGISPFSPVESVETPAGWRGYRSSALAAPAKDLSLIPMWSVLIQSLVPLAFFLLLVSCAAVCISAFSYSGVLSLILCALAGVCLIPLVSVPGSPLQTAGAALLVTGVSGQTALCASLTSLGVSVLLYRATVLGFRRKDIFC